MYAHMFALHLIRVRVYLSIDDRGEAPAFVDGIGES